MTKLRFVTNCGECGMPLTDAGEYHPQSFCRLYQQGLHPWQFLSDVLWARGWETHSAQILDRFTVREAKLTARPELRPAKAVR